MKGFGSSFLVSVPSVFVAFLWASSGEVSAPVRHNAGHKAPAVQEMPPALSPLPLSAPKEKTVALSSFIAPADSDSIKLKYRMKDESNLLPQQNDYNGGLYLNNPSNVKTEIVYDTDSNRYTITQKMGNQNFRPPSYMAQEEYIDYEFKKSMRDYWKTRSTAESMSQGNKKKNLIPPIKINSEVFDRIFGSNVVDIRPQGSAELIFGVNSSFTENPAVPVKNRRITTFDFDEKIQLSLIGKIGDRLKITTNYNTQATFDFENKMKLEFAGGEDDIIKKLEAGNVSLPLNSTLISGSQTLFGIKSELQFGKATVTAVVSQAKGQKKEINVQNGAQTSTFEINGDNYEMNKHFFLSQLFKDQYDTALRALPIISSAINVTKVEVWITNTTSNINDTRNIIALTDLGENLPAYLTNTLVLTSNAPIPDNTANSLNPVHLLQLDSRIRNKDSAVGILTTLSGMPLRPVQDFEKILSARRLSASEFTFNPRLGFVSLNTNVNPDQVVAVAFQYTYNGLTYQVGELSTDGIADPKCLFVKMLKSTNVSPKRDYLLWDLMMKNVYSIGAYQVKPDNFKLDILYNNPATGTFVPIIPEAGIPTTGQPLLQVMNLDRINAAGDAQPDGLFDYLDGVTINPANGKIYFPVRKPFGQHLRKKINPGNLATLVPIENKYAYDQLYDSTKYAAQQFPDKNRFKLKGSYKSASGSEISLNAPNIPEGSVIVTAGGVPLTENVDYTVDYALGKVKIINQGILSSGTPIKISFESNVLFNFQQKTMLGAHLNYKANRNFQWGATALRLSERPLIQKVNIGDEPVKNTMFGLDANYRNEFPFLTRMIDKLPLISTKEMSTVAATGEVASLLPGHATAIGKEGNAYIDDFEGSQSPIDIKAVGAWSLASTPQGDASSPNPLWPEGTKRDTVYGFNRAKLCWYFIDPMFMREINNLTPGYYTKAQMSDNYQREIYEKEIFPKKESQTGQPVPYQTLDLAYYPSERGMYNYNAEPYNKNGVSAAGTNPDGTLKNPASRWGGIMRKIETTDFEAANVQFIQLWMMDPFNNDLGGPYNNLQPTSGELVVQLGNISEDVLRDGKKSFENGLPTSPTDASHPVDTTSWGHVPKIQAIVNAFDNDISTRGEQDIGLDGLKSPDEQVFFNKYLQNLPPGAPTGDPSSDDYHYYRGDDYDQAKLGTLDRYKYFNGMEGNSPVSSGAYPTSSTTLPNSEDINRDNNLSETEGYFQYRVKISPNAISPTNVGNNYINSVVDGSGYMLTGAAVNCKWYQIKIPVREFEAKYGSIDDFKSIRFIRMIMRGFDKPVVLRLARVDLIRGEWRKYDYDLSSDGEYQGNDNPGTSFDISAVNYEENGTKKPVNYVLPPKIERQLTYGPTNPIHMNEQAMALKVCNLADGEARATYKNVDFDVRTYKKLRMYIHAESQATGPALNDKGLTCFVRLGTDYTQNYYEYEMPLYVTAPGTYDNSSDDERYKVWRTENEMELVFSVLQQAKEDRNAAILRGAATLNHPYATTITDPQGHTRTVYIKGNPNLSAVKTIMIGIRNPQAGSKNNPLTDDDGLPKCAEIWVNELRLSDFNEKMGYAGTARVTTKLADIGTLTMSGNYSSPGWGGIETKIGERQKETRYQYDISSQLLLQKFMPASWGISLPMYVGYSQAIIRPQYNPLDPDILLTPILRDTSLPKSYRDSLRGVTIDQTIRKSVNFTNVRKEKSKNSKHNYPFDISNFAFNYSYSKFQNHNATVQFNNIQDYRGGFVYGYSLTFKGFQPFKSVGFLNKKAFALIRDFNFNPLPNKYAVLVDVNRHYAAQLMRNTTGVDFTIPTYYDKNFTMLRSYDMKWDLTKSVKLDYHADNNSRILEPFGAIDTKEKKDVVKENLLKGGTNTLFTQRTKADYAVPLNKIPMLDWISANAGYSTDYKWTRALFSADSLGNFLQNGNQSTLNAQANMLTLYNKVPFFKKVNQGIKKKADDKSNKKKKTTLAPPKPGTPPPAPAPANPKNPKDTTKKAKKLGDYLLPQYAARTLMMLKNVSGSYTGSRGISIAGFNDSTRMFGLSRHLAPGAGFVFGQQNNFGQAGNRMYDFGDYAASRGWIVNKRTLNTPYTTNKTNNINGRANIEPVPGFKLELTANRNLSINRSEFFRWGLDTLLKDSAYVHQSPVENGNFSMSFLTWKTAFEKAQKDFSSKAFNTFLQNREEASRHLADKNNKPVPASGFAQGFGPTSQATMMFAFLSAYSGKDPSKYPLDMFPKMPAPNWRITYDGLSKLDFVKKYFKTIILSHSYRSSYSFTYTNNLESGLSKSGEPLVNVNSANDYLFYQQINSIIISEQFAPLIKIDMSTQKGIQFNVEYKKDRNLALSFANNQVTEVNGKEVVIGTGYRWKNLELKNPFSKSKSKKSIKSDLNLKCDFSIRQNLTVIRKVDEDVTQPTSGQTIYSLKNSADYQITQRITARLFYDWLFTSPRISTSFKSSNTNAGVSIRFSLI